MLEGVGVVHPIAGDQGAVEINEGPVVGEQREFEAAEPVTAVENEIEIAGPVDSRAYGR